MSNNYPLSAYIDPVTREILFDQSNGSLVELDSNILTIEFKMPKTFGQYDPDVTPFGPDNYDVYMNYTQEDPKYDQDSGYTVAIPASNFSELEGDARGYVHFLWTLDSSAAFEDGWLWFAIQVIDGTGNSWSTKAKKIRVWPRILGAEANESEASIYRSKFAVLYIAQDMTEAEKTQARSNLGISDRDTILAAGKNLFNSYSVIDAKTGSNYSNVMVTPETALIYFGENIETLFNLIVDKTLLANNDYVLSFRCENADVYGNSLPSFELAIVGTPIVDPFRLHDGVMAIHFVPTADIVSGSKLTIYAISETANINWPVHDTQIKLSEFKMEEGTVATVYEPSTESIFEKAKEADDLTHTYIEQASETGWSTAELEHAHAMATMVKTIKGAKFMTATEKASLFSNVNKRDNFRITKPLYVPLPFPMRFTALVGSTDRPAPVHVCSVDSIGGCGSVGIKYRLASPYYDDGADVPSTVVRLIVNERFHDIPADPEIPYDSSIANQIVSIGRSYVNSVANGRQYSYGGNFFYSERPDNPRSSNGLINDSLGRGRMECDTFVGLVLRGVRYEDSPYNPNGSNSHVSGGWKFVEGTPSGWEFNENSGWQYVQGTLSKWLSGQTGIDTVTRIVGNGKTGYQQFMEDTASLVTSVPWAQQLRAKMTDTVVHECYNRDAKYACDLAWMFWWISKTITNPENEWELLPNGASTQPLAEYDTLEELYGDISSYNVGDVCKADGWYYILTTKSNSKTIGCIFSNPEKAMPGDVMFARNENEGRWFDNISHVAIVTQAVDADGYLTIMEVTTAKNSSGRVVQEVNMRYRSTKPAYFARPYGWY